MKQSGTQRRHDSGIEVVSCLHAVENLVRILNQIFWAVRFIAFCLPHLQNVKFTSFQWLNNLTPTGWFPAENGRTRHLSHLFQMLLIIDRNEANLQKKNKNKSWKTVRGAGETLIRGEPRPLQFRKWKSSLILSRVSIPMRFPIS